jgi:hypothetical protein
MFLAYAFHKQFKVYQMDVKLDFLNGDIKEVYMEHLQGFQLSYNPDFVCKMKKSLYGLKQAPCVCYYRLDKYFQYKGFKRGTIDNNLYIKIGVITYSCKGIFFLWSWPLGDQMREKGFKNPPCAFVSKVGAQLCKGAHILGRRKSIKHRLSLSHRIHQINQIDDHRAIEIIELHKV